MIDIRFLRNLLRSKWIREFICEDRKSRRLSDELSALLWVNVQGGGIECIWIKLQFIRLGDTKS